MGNVAEDTNLSSDIIATHLEIMQKKKSSFEIKNVNLWEKGYTNINRGPALSRLLSPRQRPHFEVKKQIPRVDPWWGGGMANTALKKMVYQLH